LDIADAKAFREPALMVVGDKVATLNKASGK
jgi:hypothetical protein